MNDSPEVAARMSGADITTCADFANFCSWAESPPEAIVSLVLLPTVARLLSHFDRTGRPDVSASSMLAIGAKWPSVDGTFEWRSDFRLDVCGSSLAIEVDGAAYHSDRDAFERDRRKDREALLGQHMETMRFPASTVTGQIFEVVGAVSTWIARAARKAKLAEGTS